MWLDDKIGTWIDKQKCIRGLIKLYKHYDEISKNVFPSEYEKYEQAIRVKLVIAYILCHDFELYDKYYYCFGTKFDIACDYRHYRHEAIDIIYEIKRCNTDKRKVTKLDDRAYIISSIKDLPIMTNKIRKGTQVFCQDTDKIYTYDGYVWVEL